jgi:hypothetical protein
VSTTRLFNCRRMTVRYSLALLSELSFSLPWVFVALAPLRDDLVDSGGDPAQVEELPLFELGKHLTLPLASHLYVDVSLARGPIGRYLRDASTIRIGPLELAAQFTATRAIGCTSWSFAVKHGRRELRAVGICAVIRFPSMSPAGWMESKACARRVRLTCGTYGSRVGTEST